MKKFSLVMLVLPLVFFAQEWNWNFMGSGARALSMGGAFISIADDATSITWNPAGIAQLIRPEVSISGGFKSENWDPGEAYYGYSNSHVALDFGSIVYPLSLGNMRFVFSFAYHTIMESYYEETDTVDFVDATYIYYEQLKGAMAAITPAIGFNMGPFSLGASFDIWKFGPKYYWFERYYGTGFDTTYEYWEKNNPMSLGINLGALFASPMFKFGGIVRLPHSLRQHIIWNDEWSGDYNATNDGEYEGDTLGFPIMFGFGGSVILGNILTIAADYEIRPYSNMTENGEESDAYDCNQLRVGAELMFNIDKFALPLRVGYMTDPRTYDDDNGQIVGHIFTAGMGMVIDRISFDIGGSFGISKEQYSGMTEPGTYTTFKLLGSLTVRI